MVFKDEGALVITLLAPIDYTEASLASGGKVKVGSDGKSFTFDLADDADALILRL